MAGVSAIKTEKPVSKVTGLEKPVSKLPDLSSRMREELARPNSSTV